MQKLLYLLAIIAFTTTCAFAQEGYDAIQPANPLSPQEMPVNTIALPIKKATLTHNSVHNQYVIAFDRFMQSNVKSDLCKVMSSLHIWILKSLLKQWIKMIMPI